MPLIFSHSPNPEHTITLSLRHTLLLQDDETTLRRMQDKLPHVRWESRSSSCKFKATGVAKGGTRGRTPPVDRRVKRGEVGDWSMPLHMCKNSILIHEFSQISLPWEAGGHLLFKNPAYATV